MLRGRTPSFWKFVLRLRVFLLPAVLLLAVTLPHLEQGDFRGDAGWYSAIGLQAWRAGELWTLYGEPGVPYFNKPPLAFWIHGLVLHLLGPHIWAARLPTVVAALGCVLITVAIGRELGGRRAGMFSGIVLALTLEFFRRTREVSLDMWQALFLIAALWCVVRTAAGESSAAEQRGRVARWFVCAGLMVGLALLTKPLVALLFFPIIAAWLAWVRRPRLAAWLGLAVIAALLVSTPWHLSMVQLHGEDFVGHYFGTEVAKRAAGRLLAGHDRPPEWWFYFRKLATLYWPWLVPTAAGVVLAVARAFQPAQRQAESLPHRSQSLQRLALVWVAPWLLFLTVYPDRRDRYAIVLYPALAWLAGSWLTAVRWSQWRWTERALLRGLGPFAATVALAVALAPVQIQKPPERHWQELLAWMHAQPGGAPELWQGGVEGWQSARLYLEFRAWPRTTRDRRGELIANPPPGAMLLYHRRGGWAPGDNEHETFRTTGGDLWITRLGPGGWRPRPAKDPGE
jgi:4-amino-4-deoxy-L-arabinose transferase-like glycosyltransferase